MAQDGAIHDGKAHRPPISTHPAFPLIVGLWFAALLGLGTIVVPAVVLERAASATGLVGIFPQAEPPLGAGARAAVALLAALVGFAGGLLLARRVVDTQRPRSAPRRRTANPAKRAAPPKPLSIHDDLGEQAIAPTVDERRPTLPGRRRGLAAIQEERSSDLLIAAPLPGDDPHSAPELLFDEDAMSERPSEIAFPEDQPAEDLDLIELAEDPSASPEPHDGTAAGAPEGPLPYVPPLDTRKPRDVAAPPPPLASEAAAADDAAPIDAPLDDLGIVQLAERLGRSLQRRIGRRRIASEASAEAEPLPFSPPSLDHADEEPALTVPPPVVPDALRAFMDSPPEEAVEAPAESPPPPVPAALAPMSFDPFDDDEEDDAGDPGPFTLPLGAMPPRPFEAPAVPSHFGGASGVDAFDQDDDEDEEAEVADGSFSSLLTMRNPFRTSEEFVRVEEPEALDDAAEPAVVFPGQETAAGEAAQPAASDSAGAARPFDTPHQPAPSTAPTRAPSPADPAETERALRSALANLQRMSGAA